MINETVIEKHIAEYHGQIEQHQRQVIALQGAIQALERLQREQGQGQGGEDAET